METLHSGGLSSFSALPQSQERGESCGLQPGGNNFSCSAPRRTAAASKTESLRETLAFRFSILNAFNHFGVVHLFAQTKTEEQTQNFEKLESQLKRTAEKFILPVSLTA